MPTTYAGNPASYPATVTIPVGGDARTAASVDVGLQALADRTANLKALLDAGVKLAKHYTDVAALRGETTHTDGSIAVLNGGGSGAFYIYDAASSRADDGALCIKPTDVGGGAGRWLHPFVKALAVGLNITGAWAFVQDITASAGINATGNISTQGDLFASGDLTCQAASVASLTCSGAATISGLTTCAAGLVVNGGSGIDCNGACDVSGASSLHGAVHCYSTLQVDSTSTFTGKITAGGGVDINGASTLTKRMVTSSQGGITERIVQGADADHTYSFDDADTIYVPSLTDDRTYTLAEAGAVDGCTIEIRTFDTGHTISVNTPSDGNILLMKAGGTSIYRAIFKFYASHWRIWEIEKAWA